MADLPQGSTGRETLPGARRLALVVGATFLARAVAGSAVGSLRARLWLTDQALGTLASAFAFPFALSLPLGAVLGRRRRFGAVAAGGLALCGVSTAAGAAAIGFWTLVLARVAAGAGAGLAAGVAFTRAQATAQHPGDRRVRSGFLLAGAGGIALGYLVGAITFRWPRWQCGFLAAGALLVLAAAACASAATEDRQAGPLRLGQLDRAVRRLVSPPHRLLAVLAAVVATSGGSALLYWLPAFLERGRGVPVLVASAQLALAVIGSALAGSALCRAVIGREPGRRAAWTAAGGTGAAALFTGASLRLASPAWALPCAMMALLGLFAAARAAAANLCSGAKPLAALPSPDEDRTAAAPQLALLALAGETSGAFLLGAIADRASFGWALLIIPSALAASAALWAAAGSCRAASRDLTPPRGP
ncbi:MAG TPA: MFS transporter [Anaeromyxobacter sp.]|nr:MFS transporter [Anaeromyxobacter sp.]